MRKITQFHDADKPDPTNLLLAVDVSSRTLDLYSRYRQGGTEYEVAESFRNDLTTISGRLDAYAKQARGLGYNGLSLVVEPSGRYENKLTQTALQRGHRVWTVNPERMYKAGIVHHGDGGKSDPLDGKVLYMLARMGKVSRLVLLPGVWQRLRHLGQWLEDCTLAAAATRIREQAQSSSAVPLPPDGRQIVSDQLNHLWGVWSEHTERKGQLEDQMIALVDGLNSACWVPPLFSGFSECMRAKILAETGPLRRFPHWRALVAYAGLKIRMRRSGTWRGKDKITKKGRILLRKHLGQAAFSLLRKDRRRHAGREGQSGLHAEVGKNVIWSGKERSAV